MSAETPASPSSGELDAARLLLARLGVRPEDLLAPVASERPAAPSFAEYVPVVSGAVSDGTRRVYGSYWNRLVEQWGDRRLDEPTPTEIEALSRRVRAGRVIRRNGRGGSLSAEHFIAALRCLYRHAVDDELVADNPAKRVAKPRRVASTRHALVGERLAEINEVAASTGDDPVLDTLLLRLHTETACRRGGALALRPCDLDAEQCLILLREKGGTSRLQPVSPTLMAHLLAHAAERGAPREGQLLRRMDGTPITRRRYNSLFARIGRHLPWAAAQGVSAHWLRHTTLTWVERVYGYAVAQAYAGHAEGTGGEDTTLTYARAKLPEVAAALAGLVGEDHPLAEAHPSAGSEMGRSE
ncbi:tyrosine-type recombinase/integrase [Cryptosporangium sp. NPDC048952]|uniref:tyrosine-type recombinase/integrase n=1 Tax=Cryptosporangium sp. NPDC048952 TaxID=3363961 RepID=UPI003711C90C